MLVLSTTNSDVSIASFAFVIGVPVEIASSIFSLVFSVTNGIAKKLKYNE